MTKETQQADGLTSHLTQELDAIEVKNRILLAIKQADLLVEQWKKDRALTFEQMNTPYFGGCNAA